MARSSWKPPYVAPSLVRHSLGDGVHPVYSRASTVLPAFVGHSFRVHTGKTFVQVKVQIHMVGKKFGEFALTRRPGKHPRTSKGGKK